MKAFSIRVFLLFVFLLSLGCLGGPKVDPPEIASSGSAGERTVSMDAGILHPTTGGTSEKEPRSDYIDTSTSRSDAKVIDEDDAGSPREL